MVELDKHWELVYETKKPTEVSWYQLHLRKSLELISRTGISKDVHVIDVGGGVSTLVDDLLAQGFKHVTVLDIAAEALSVSKSRLGKSASQVTWIEADITQVVFPSHAFDVWHDRAVFHFLTNAEDRCKYVNAARHSLKPGGHLIIAAFSLNGPPRCSGLDVVRYSLQTMQAEFGSEFELVESLTEKHVTPFNTKQEFVYCHFKLKSKR